MIKLQHPQVPLSTLEIIPVYMKEVEKYLGKIKLNEIKVIFFGSDLFVIPILQALEDNFEVVAVVTASDSAVANYFKGPIFTSGKLDENFQSQISNFKPDLFVVASFGKIIPKFILNIPKFGSLNVHPSLLPKYRGPSPIQQAILNGDSETGITIIKMDEEVDHGPIIYQDTLELFNEDNFDTLSKKMFQQAAEVLPKIIEDFAAGKITLKKQNDAIATFCDKLTRESGYFPIDNQPDPQKLNRMIRAYYPWPGVWTRFRPSGSSGQARIVKFLPGNMLQMEGKKAISLKDFLNGYPDFPLKSTNK